MTLSFQPLNEEQAKLVAEVTQTIAHMTPQQQAELFTFVRRLNTILLHKALQKITREDFTE